MYKKVLFYWLGLLEACSYRMHHNGNSMYTVWTMHGYVGESQEFTTTQLLTFAVRRLKATDCIKTPLPLYRIISHVETLCEDASPRMIGERRVLNRIAGNDVRRIVQHLLG